MTRPTFSSALHLGQLIKQQLEQDPHFYLFSPDETTSNKIDAAFDVSARAWNLPVKPQDLPSASDGRIIELLSENTLFACMLGHLLNGEQAIMASYEAFYNIITSQIVQHLKFIQQSAQTTWRPEYPAVNLLSTSTCWRQDHNGFSHQSPLLISSLLAVPSQRTNCLFPVDRFAAEAAFDFMLQSKNVVNLTTFNKTPEPEWQDQSAANQAIKQGFSIFEEFSATDPDFVLVAAGDIATREAVYAIKILQQELKDTKFRLINLAALSYNAIGTTNNPLSQADFDQNFTIDKPIIANFHGFPETLRSILSRYADATRLTAHGFSEQGSTTTPFEMLSLNHASRFHLAISVAERINRSDLVQKYQEILAKNSTHAHEFGLDLPEITGFC